jgi:hypothetical protein
VDPPLSSFRVFGVFRGSILKLLVADHRRDSLPPNTRNTRKKRVDPPLSSFRVFSVFRGSILSCWSSTTEEILYHRILGTHGKREWILRGLPSVCSVCSVVALVLEAI